MTPIELQWRVSISMFFFMPFHVRGKKNNEIVPALHHGHSFQRAKEKKENKYVYIVANMPAVIIHH